MPVALRLFLDPSGGTSSFGGLFAMVLVSIGPVLGFFLASQRLLVQGHRHHGLQVISRPETPHGQRNAREADQDLCRRTAQGRQRADARHRRRRVPRARRPVGLRQVDGAAHDRRTRGDHRRRRLDRRRVRQRHPPQGPGHRHGVPELCALSAYVGLRQHRLPAADREAAEGRDRQARARGRAHPRARGLPQAPARDSSRAASASASPWAAPSCASRPST